MLTSPRTESPWLAAEAVQQDHQGDKQPRHQADEPVVMRQIAKAGTMLTADPIEGRKKLWGERRRFGIIVAG
jgi:hypothetical protein